VRITIAAATAIADGPLPIGDLISAGLELWMLWDLVGNWDTYGSKLCKKWNKNKQFLKQSLERKKNKVNTGE
jgi:hypothetical protein